MRVVSLFAATMGLLWPFLLTGHTVEALKTCDARLCSKAGECSVEADRSIESETIDVISCDCDEHHFGPQCEHTIPTGDERCAKNRRCWGSCSCRGTCLDYGGDISVCKCDAGWEGPDCSQQSEEVTNLIQVYTDENDQPLIWSPAKRANITWCLKRHKPSLVVKVSDETFRPRLGSHNLEDFARREDKIRFAFEYAINAWEEVGGVHFRHVHDCNDADFSLRIYPYSLYVETDKFSSYVMDLLRAPANFSDYTYNAFVDSLLLYDQFDSDSVRMVHFIDPLKPGKMAVAFLPGTSMHKEISVTIRAASEFWTLRSAFIHELGHAIGLLHEFDESSPDPNCRNSYQLHNFKKLSPYDPSSVMTYEHCNGTQRWSDPLFAPSTMDTKGVRDLYGPPSLPKHRRMEDRKLEVPLIGRSGSISETIDGNPAEWVVVFLPIVAGSPLSGLASHTTREECDVNAPRLSYRVVISFEAAGASDTICDMVIATSTPTQGRDVCVFLVNGTNSCAADYKAEEDGTNARVFWWIPTMAVSISYQALYDAGEGGSPRVLVLPFYVRNRMRQEVQGPPGASEIIRDDAKKSSFLMCLAMRSSQLPSMEGLPPITAVDFRINFLSDVDWCDPKFQSVRQISLTYNWFNRLDLRCLKQLRVVSAGSNNLRNFHNFKVHSDSLLFLSLTSNGIRTTKDMPHLPNLQYLDLSHNKLREFDVELSATTVEVNLSANLLTEMPQRLCSLELMENLNLASNLIETIPSCISRLSKAYIINLSDNRLSSLPDMPTALQRLLITDNPFVQVPQSIQNLPNLDSLSLSNTNITTLPEWIAKCPPLLLLNIAGTPLARDHLVNTTTETRGRTVTETRIDIPLLSENNFVSRGPIYPFKRAHWETDPPKCNNTEQPIVGSTRRNGYDFMFKLTVVKPEKLSGMKVYVSSSRTLGIQSMSVAMKGFRIVVLNDCVEGVRRVSVNGGFPTVSQLDGNCSFSAPFANFEFKEYREMRKSPKSDISYAYHFGRHCACFVDPAGHAECCVDKMKRTLASLKLGDILEFTAQSLSFDSHISSDMLLRNSAGLRFRNFS